MIEISKPIEALGGTKFMMNIPINIPITLRTARGKRMMCASECEKENSLGSM